MKVRDVHEELYSVANYMKVEVGASCVNALSEEFSVIVKTGGIAYRCDFEKGIIKKHLYKLKDKISKEDTGTTVIYRPDNEIWGDEWVDFKAIERRCRQLAYLNLGLEISLVIDSVDSEGEPVKAEYGFKYDDGIIGYVEKLTQSKSLVGDIVRVYTAPKISVPPGDTDNNKLVDTACLDTAFAWTESYSTDIKSFVNNVHTVYGGDHELGFREGLVKAIKRYALEYKLVKDAKQIESGDCLEGLTVILSTRIKDPVYEGQGKGKLKSTAIRGQIRDDINNFFYDYLCQDNKRAKVLIDKILKAGKARLAAKRARDTARGLKETSSITGLPGKLCDCVTKNPEEAEIFFVEGDSAAGSASEGRDPQTQAVMGIFGKILNAEKARIDKIIDSIKIRDIITALGVGGIGQDCDVSKLRYHKVISMADSDPDGLHINILMLTFFYRYMRPLVENGYVYVANAPLYRLTKGKGKKIERKYVLNDSVLAQMNTEGWNITHIKGLGELNPEELWDTAMNPKTRVLTKVTIEDAEAAESILSTCMGEAVEPRKRFIFEQLK